MKRTLGMTRVGSVLIVLALLATACGSGDDDTASGGDTTGAETADDEAPVDDEADADETDEVDEPDETEEPERTASWKGVTPDTITIGVTMLDIQSLVPVFLPAGWGDQQGVWEALVAELNANGGINGRQIEVVYEFYSPIDAADAERACAAITQDHDVFASLGGFLGPAAGTADPCIVGLNDTILIGGEQTRSELALAKAPWYTTGASTESRIGVLLDLLIETGRADDAKVFIVSAASATDDESFAVDALADRGIEVVGTGSILANDGDTVSQDAELRVIMERVRERGATTILINGNPSAPIRGIGAAGLDRDVAMWATDPGGLANLGNTIEDKSIADGAITVMGRVDTERWEQPTYQSECSEVVAARLPEADLRPPTEYLETDENWFNPVSRACGLLALFVAIATAAGMELTPTTFLDGANSLTQFALPGSPFNSLGPDKLNSSDEVRLGEYDHAEGDGGLVALSELVHVTR